MYPKLAKMAALRIKKGDTVGDIDSIGSLDSLKSTEMNQMKMAEPKGSIPTTTRGLKESQTKKLRNMMKLR